MRLVLSQAAILWLCLLPLGCADTTHDDDSSGCTDLQLDPSNCGTCGIACRPGQICSRAACE